MSANELSTIPVKGMAPRHLGADLSSEIEMMLQWSEPKQVKTQRGAATVRTAPANGKFWNLWRSGKADLQSIGISPRKDPTSGEWEINWYQREQAPAPQPQAEVALPTSPNAIYSKPIAVSKPSSVKWSEEQEAIFEWFRSGSGHLVVRARAGTGKTTTIKVAFTHAPEERMLYAVFNKKNQVEASRAIDDPRVEIKTLHSVGYSFIQNVWPGAKPDDGVEFDRVEKVVGEQTVQQVKTAVKKLVGFAKNCFVSPTRDDLVDLAEKRDVDAQAFEDEVNGGWTRVKLADSALKVLTLSKERDPQGRISFDDMVWLPVAQGWVRAIYDLVVVDEAQDMNLPQLLTAKSSVKPGGRICVVGDDRQAIYGFRGAAQDGMDMMRQSLEAAELGLTITYRCPKRVVALAAALVPDYKAAAAAPEGFVDHIEAIRISSEVEPGDAVLSRANAPLMPLCLGLLRKGVPARIEGRDIGKALADVAQKLNARTVPQFIEKVEAWRMKQTNRMKASKNFEQKSQEIADKAECLTAVAEGASSVSEIFSRLSELFQDSADSTRAAVVLSTVHKAKGLEWECVYLLSDTFNRKRPVSAPPMSPEAELARAKEEANIYYVALTRSKSELILCEGKP
jgi:hypothetical protein